MINFTSVILIVCLTGVLSHPEPSNDSEEMIYRVSRGIKDRKKAGECRYKKGPWEECDSASNMEKRTLTLKRGDSNCEQTKVLTRKCKKGISHVQKACKYDKGEWNECDAMSNMRTRTDTLKPKSDASCDPTRTISKKCKKACRYNKQVAWSECDATTNKKTKVLVLITGDASCEQNKKVIKPCRGGKKGGKGKHLDDDDDYEDEE